jgi:F0F1-type ATP synthase membrane subunit b/b'
MTETLFTVTDSDRIAKAEARLAVVETALLDAEARLPALRREITAIRADLRSPEREDRDG